MVRCRRGPQHFVRSLQGNQALLFMVALAGSEFSGRSAVWYFEVIHKPEVTILLLKTEKKPKKEKGKLLRHLSIRMCRAKQLLPGPAGSGQCLNEVHRDHSSGLSCVSCRALYM